ncbi:MAG: Paraquat-inducible protein, partial [Bacteroidota bacterium]
LSTIHPHTLNNSSATIQLPKQTNRLFAIFTSMKWASLRRDLGLVLWVVSAGLFIMAATRPLFVSGFAIGPITLRKDPVYLSDSFRYFFTEGEWLIGSLLLLFTIVFPILKYLFLLGVMLLGWRPRRNWQKTALDFINKWAMLDVFVVAVFLLHLKFDSRFLISRLGSGTTLFAASILLLIAVTRLVLPERKGAGPTTN